MISEGETAPDFELLGTDGEEIDTYRLENHLDDGPVVVTFYLFDFHPECRGALCSVRDAGWLSFTDGVEVLGISTDKVFSHRAFAEEIGIQFPLLSDGDGEVSESFGVLQEEFRGHKSIAQRSAFVIDESRTVRYAWSSGDPSEHPDLTEIAEIVGSLAETADASK